MLFTLGGPRFGPGASKLALTSYLRARTPNPAFVSPNASGQSYENIRMMQQHQQQQQAHMIRHRLSMHNKSRMMNRMTTGQEPVYGQQMGMGPATTFPQSMPSQQSEFMEEISEFLLSYLICSEYPSLNLTVKLSSSQGNLSGNSSSCVIDIS